MNESQIKDVFKVFSEENVVNICMTQIKEGESIISIYGSNHKVGEMMAQAIINNKEVERLVVTSLLGFLAQRSSNPDKTVLDFLNVLKESE